ncbi:putative PhzA/B-like protein [Klebsiella variicola]|uniref:nuclear transport factor 2 family protein n=1 Tax=Klebsiella variicola TaxID=244366 RepID=UPI0021810C82|nr:nuclear transport factor 2 family protein [Klebsiella variicola]EKW2290596.1 nuclear transport factor 2 family protein [Klebsiella variicola]ELA3318770.1 nuclear transport factor 2 family protein [Klebsiella variicola]GKI33910.1 putative PhzA/B-like protein [Klebsiella variicola]HCI8843493.1 nuclear transport factor 2 family protein [Klebsiella variicola]
MSHENEEIIASKNRSLALEVLQTVGTERNYELMADDIVIEFPYGPSLGMPDRFEGKETVVTYLRQMAEQLKGLKMKDITVHSVAGNPDMVFAEYKGDAPTPGGGFYTQIYINRLTFRNGLMTSMREFWDPKRIVDALNGRFEGNV